MDTGVKAGIIKCATDEPGVTPDVERVLRASAQAHRRTGVPISTHTHAASEVGLKQQDIFESEGADLSRIVIGHSGDSEDIAYLRKICDRGSYIGMDRFGVDIFLPTPQARGHDRQDVRAGLRREDGALPRRGLLLRLGGPQLLTSVVPNWHFNHIPDDVLPALRAAGVTDEQITAMTVDNPRRIFEKQGSY